MSTYQSFLTPGRAVDLRGVLDLVRDRRAAGDEDHDGEREDPPGVHERDRDEREVRAAEPLERHLRVLLEVHGGEQPDEGVVEVEPGERPVDDAVERVEQPQPPDRREDDRGRPRQDHEEADEPLAAEVADEEVREHRGADEDDRLRGEREDERVAERAPEVLVLPGVREVVEADPVAGERPADRVGEAQVDRPDERDAHDERHEDDRRGDEQGREDAAALESVPPAPSSRFHPRRLRLHETGADASRFRPRRQTWPRSPSRA